MKKIEKKKTNSKKIKTTNEKLKQLLTTKTTNNKKIQKNNKQAKQDKTKKISYKNLTISEIEQELKRETYKSKYKQVLMSTVYALIIVASVAAIVATLIMPVLQISGSSMNPTLSEGEIVVSIKNQNLKTGDVIAFYHGNKILIKRVIALPGSWVNITKEGDVFVNSVLLEETYIKNKSFGESDLKFPYQVPEETYFVLGDDRESSIDSRNSVIGTISKDDIIGKVIFKIWPFKEIGTINK